MFFRRNADLDMSIYQCKFDGQCDVNAHSRRSCRSCRMKKCLAIGMNKEFFRSPHSSKHVRRQHVNDVIQLRNKILSRATIRPLNLLSNDRSLLNLEQWSLLSNVLHCYDAHCPISEIQRSMAVYSMCPPKHRLKVAANNLMVTINLFFSSVWSFVEAVPHFAELPGTDRRNLIQRNVHQMGALNGAHVCQEGKFHDDPTNQGVAIAEYGASLINYMMKAIELGSSDRTVSKLFLLVMSFSTCSDMVQPLIDDNGQWTDYSLLSDPIQIFNIQNLFVDIIFKYMIYQSGYTHASLHFAHLIVNALKQGEFIQKAQMNQNHDVMVQTIIHGFEQSLIIR
ncbi:unnamed protein product [Rotaria sordida]|uniref:Nuclear receptor domain-containing protein n=1 Tax=Rotaria sordida TaxID=392033 RepID=A0A814UCC4_9BILA|nr:unnamed protein product [Rotaria sordida]